MRKTKQYYETKIHEYSLNLTKDSAHYKLLEYVKSLGDKPLKILDVGCARGYLGAKLKELGHEVYGVEISEKAAKEAKKVLDDVIVGDIEEIDLPYSENYFDVIICADVLEHLYDPKLVLLRLRRYLKSDGILIASIPNIANWKIRLDLLRGKFEYSTVGLLDFGHIRLFTYYTAKKMFEETGFEIMHVDYTVNWYDLILPLRLLLKGIKKIVPFIKCKSERCINLIGFQIIFVVRKYGER